MFLFHLRIQNHKFEILSEIPYRLELWISWPALTPILKLHGFVFELLIQPHDQLLYLYIAGGARLLTRES